MLPHDANRGKIVGEQSLRLIEEWRANPPDDGFSGTFVHAAVNQRECGRIACAVTLAIPDISQQIAVKEQYSPRTIFSSAISIIRVGRDAEGQSGTIE